MNVQYSEIAGHVSNISFSYRTGRVRLMISGFQFNGTSIKMSQYVRYVGVYEYNRIHNH
jgi:hypothetical protein